MTLTRLLEAYLLSSGGAWERRVYQPRPWGLPPASLVRLRRTRSGADAQPAWPPAGHTQLAPLGAHSKAKQVRTALTWPFATLAAK